MSIWYCEVSGCEEGPYTSSQLIKRIHAGDVTKDTPVRKDDSQWVRAIEVAGLFAAAARPIVRKLCPYCGSEDIGAVPCTCPGCERQIQRVVKRNVPSPVRENGERNPDAPSQPKGAGIKKWVKKLFD